MAGYVTVASYLTQFTATQEGLHISILTLGNPLGLHMENYLYIIVNYSYTQNHGNYSTHKLIACFHLLQLFWPLCFPALAGHRREVCLEVTICAIVVDQNFLVGKKLGTKLYVHVGNAVV